MDRTTEYAKLIVSGARLAGRTEYLCCKRHLDDMEKGKDFDYIFDVEMAEEAISLANELTIGEGTEKVQLETRGFQNFIIGSLHGWRVKRKKELRYREAYIQLARQNGKSFLSATEVNKRVSFSGYELGRAFCGATKQDQANIVWDEVKKFIISDDHLKELYTIREHENTIISNVTGTEFKSIGRDTKSIDGFRSILAVIDEYHAHKTNEMYDLLRDGQIDVSSALTFAITTAGFNIGGPCHEQYKFAKKVVSNVIEKESLFVYITEMDMEEWTDEEGNKHEADDIWDYHNWAKANPYLLWEDDTTLDQDMIARMAEKAIDAREKEGSDLLNFMTKSLNVWVAGVENQYVKNEDLEGCFTDLTLEDMRGREAYLGIDLSSGGDLTSIGLVFPLENEKYYLYSHSFMPELRMQKHEQTDDVPYRMWHKQGLLTLTDGGFGLKTDYRYIIQHLKDIIEQFDIEILEVGFDGHNASAFIGDLDFLGCDLTEIIQSAKSLNDATVDLRLAIEAGQLLIDRKNTLLIWSFTNAVTTSNSFGEIKIDKQAVTNRIDPIDAAIDAWKIMFLNKTIAGVDPNEDVDDWFELMSSRKEK